MIANLPDFSRVRLLVVGDLMLDRYYSGDTRRVSPEAPVQVVDVGKVEARPGGAANVAVNAAALGAQVELIGFVGDDARAETLRDMLRAHGVACRFIAVAGSPTVLKSRIVSRGQQLMRLDFEDGFLGAPQGELERAVGESLGRADAVILSDYAKGCLARVEPLIALARAASKKVFVDPKGCNFDRYQGAFAITPNLDEFVAAFGEHVNEAELIFNAREVCDGLALGALLVTRGADGMLLVEDGGGVARLPASVHEVFDVTGAGDTAISVFACAIAAGLPAPAAAHLANRAAGRVVEKFGAAAVAPEELARALGGAHVSKGAHTADELAELVARARRRGERIVMTNGCFDLLHAGHVDYLTRAAALGDRLIVAINDDASVARLKGKERPFVPLDARMQVLAALEAVDWVVPFDEDTPARLIKAVAPDVLVKGGDYRPADIAGHDQVTANGGQVLVLDYLPGHSTSALAQRLRDSKPKP